MFPDNIDLAETSEIKNKAPGIFQVLGAAVLDIGLVLAFWFIAMIFASAIWAISELIAHSGQMPNTQPGSLALLLISMPTLYLAILALSAWRGRKLLLKQTPIPNTRLVMLAVMTGSTLFLLTVSSIYALNAAGMELKPGNQALLENLSHQWPILIVIFCGRDRSNF